MASNPNASYTLMLIAALATAGFWGIYGPILHWGQLEMGHGRLRTFICVGIAYFLVAIVVPLIFMAVTGAETDKQYHATTMGIVYSLLGGALGALGALGIIVASTYSPLGPATPTVIMPIVFGLAPVVNTFFTLWMNRNKEMEPMSPFFAAGLILAAVGAASVIFFAPKPIKQKPVDHAKASAKPDADLASELRHMNAANNQQLADELAKAEAAEQSE
jgi:hypothetical protein